jgi:hypothetical protein
MPGSDSEGRAAVAERPSWSATSSCDQRRVSTTKTPAEISWSMHLWLSISTALARLSRSPAALGLTVLLLYGVLLIALLRGGLQARDFTYQGRYFVTKSSSSPYIKLDPKYSGYDYLGYDGQFFYYIALDPAGALPYIDTPSYRYTRIGYPIVARVLALGRAAWVPYTLILVNWLSIAGGAAAVGTWLKRRGHSPWLAIVYGLYPGFFLSLRYDLSEALAFGLATAAISLFDSGRPWVRATSALLFGAALLSRESVGTFALVFTALQLFEGRGLSPGRRLQSNLLPTLLFAGLWAGPYIAWRLFLLMKLGNLGAGLNELFEPVPFLGIGHFALHGWERGSAQALREIVFPAVIFAGMVLYAFWKRGPFAMGWLYLLNFVPFVVFLTRKAYVDELSSARVTAGVVLAAILCVPYLVAAAATLRTWFWAASALWLASVPQEFLAPVAQYVDHAFSHRLLHRS